MSVIYRYFQLALFHARFQKFIPGIGGWEGGLSPGIILVTREMRELTLVTLLLVCEFQKNIEFPGDYTYPSFKIRACFMHSAL